MSLYLLDQKLGSHSGPESSSHKFMLKGRQTGSMHRGHAWVFRAESYETMLAWFEDIKNLTEKTGEERNNFVRKHARSFSGRSDRPASISSDGAMEEDEADETPYSANVSLAHAPPATMEQPPQRPQPGGRFPSDLQVNRGLQAPLSPSSGDSSGNFERDNEVIAAAGAIPGTQLLNEDKMANNVGQQQEYPTRQRQIVESQRTAEPAPAAAPTPTPVAASSYPMYQSSAPMNDAARTVPQNPASQDPQGLTRHQSNYGDWMAPAAAGLGGAAVGTAGVEAYRQHKAEEPNELQADAIPAGTIHNDEHLRHPTAETAPRAGEPEIGRPSVSHGLSGEAPMLASEAPLNSTGNAEPIPVQSDVVSTPVPVMLPTTQYADPEASAFNDRAAAAGYGGYPANAAGVNQSVPLTAAAAATAPVDLGNNNIAGGAKTARPELKKLTHSQTTISDLHGELPHPLSLHQG